ncbi:AAA family ATPase, partial [Tritonibacter sp. SIMBA_163]|uniref:AAA family ATPase n=1 Tax=Tritonibacter sp. SIMBA_163 TaxID=3080868 RepID=UPI00397FF0BA
MENYDVVILDEASMIVSEVLELLINQITLFTAKFLFLGDPAQLPPVNETQSPVFSQITAQAQLTKVMRYDGAILN